MKELWDLQAEFTKRVLKKIHKDISAFDEDDKVKWTKEYLLFISKEGTEALDELNWKQHVTDKKDINDRNIKIELIDMQKYLWGLMCIWGVSYKEFCEIFKDKSYEVEKKWIQNFELKGVNENNKKCIIDIDGVLNYYPQCFYDWANKHYNISKEDLLGNRVEYENIKKEYRCSGIKRVLPANQSSVDALVKLKDLGYSIILMTNRPYTEYKNIVFDTYFWLDNNNIPYDYLYWSINRKVVDASKRIQNIDFVVDDTIEVCQDFANLGIKAYLLGGNVGDSDEVYQCIDSMQDIKELKNVRRDK